MPKRPLVLLESPYRGVNQATLHRNIAYARRAMRDAFERGEFPLAGHLLYTQLGILNEADAEERNLGIAATLSWGKAAVRTVVYDDYGVSAGMHLGIRAAHRIGRPVEYRHIGENPRITEPLPAGLTPRGPRRGELLQ